MPTVFLSKEIAPDGTIFLKFRKSDGFPHRTAIPPIIDADAQLDAVDVDLLRMGMSKIAQSDRNAIRAEAKRVHTEDVRGRFIVANKLEPDNLPTLEALPDALPEDS